VETVTGPVSPAEYGEGLTDAELEEQGYAAGLDVWGQVEKAYENYLGDGTLANSQLWSLREAVRHEAVGELLTGCHTAPGSVLLAGIEADEKIARDALYGPADQRWRVKGYDRVVQRGYRAPGEMTDMLIADCGPMGSTRSRHIARNGPGRVLRDAAARRKILAAWQDSDAGRDRDDPGGYRNGLADGLQVAAEYLAAVYATPAGPGDDS
jgi:Family of unknown function (DUF6221)